MTFVAFVIDTSQSMSAKTSNGRTLMDHAKDAVEQMTTKKRQTPAHFVLLTSCLLLTTEEWPGGVKTSWTDWTDRPEKRAARFQEQLKKLAPGGQSDVASALGKAFDMLGQHRFRTGVDTWGKGRCPWCTEPGAVVLITDGKNAFMDFSASGSVDGSEAFTTDDEGDDDGDEVGREAKRSGVSWHRGEGRTRRMPLTMDAVGVAAASSAVGSELCGRPFRWDQRLFTLLIRAGDDGKGSEGDGAGRDVVSPEFDEVAITALKNMCEMTGGCLMRWDEGDPLQQPLASHIDTLMRKLQKQGPVVMFQSEDPHDPAGEDSDDFDGFANDAVHRDSPRPPMARAGLLLRSGNGIWPIPEPFWVDRNLEILPQREEAQPEIIFRRTDAGSGDVAAASTEHLEHLGNAVDHYELEWLGKGSRLDVPRSAVWPLFVRGSGPSPGQPDPFGYLRSSQTPGKTVMVVLPYNYPTLVPLLQQRNSMVQHNGTSAPPSSTSPWAREFVAYTKGVPSYYHPALHRVLQSLGVQGLIPAETSANGGGVLNRKITERLMSLKDLAARQVERADRMERARRATQDSERSQQSQDPGSAGGPTGSLSVGPSGSKRTLYSTAFQIPVGELLSQWEGMRTQLFGSGGATVEGLFSGAEADPRPARLGNPGFGTSPIPGDDKRRREDKKPLDSSRSGDKSVASDDCGGGSSLGGSGRGGLRGFVGWGRELASPVLRCVAESLAPTRTTQEMSDYISRMQGVEFPRDPLGEPEPDENTPQGGLRRLMASTTFESPWAKDRGGGFSSLGLDEAANESAILVMNTESNASPEEANKDTGDSEEIQVEDRPTPSDSCTTPSCSSTEVDGSSGAVRDANRPSSSSAESDETQGSGKGAARTAGDGSGSGVDGQTGPTPRVSKACVSRWQLPKLVAIRGRRKLSKGLSTPLAKPTASGSSAFSNGTGPGSENYEMDVGDGPAGDGKRLIPPASPAPVAPQTPDYPPPPDSPVYRPGGDFRRLESESDSDEEAGSAAAPRSTGPTSPSDRNAAEAVAQGGTGGGDGRNGPRKLDYAERAVEHAGLAHGKGSGETSSVIVGGKSDDKSGVGRDARDKRESNGDAAEQRPRGPPPRPPPPRPSQAEHKSTGKPRPPPPRPPPPRPPLPSSPSPSSSSEGPSARTPTAPNLSPTASPASSGPRQGNVQARKFVQTDSPIRSAPGFSLPGQAQVRAPAPATATSMSMFKVTDSPASRPVGSWTSDKPTSQTQSIPAAPSKDFKPTGSPAMHNRTEAHNRPNASGQRQPTAGAKPRPNGDAHGVRGQGVPGPDRTRKRPREEVLHGQEQRKLGPHDYILPEGWVVARSKNQNREYYFNTATNVSQWEPPPGSRPR